ncbi:hypothetical protein V2G26_006817 [Clonostachys chloroleuca]
MVWLLPQVLLPTPLPNHALPRLSLPTTVIDTPRKLPVQHPEFRPLSKPQAVGLVSLPVRGLRVDHFEGSVCFLLGLAALLLVSCVGYLGSPHTRERARSTFFPARTWDSRVA